VIVELLVVDIVSFGHSTSLGRNPKGEGKVFKENFDWR